MSIIVNEFTRKSIITLTDADIKALPTTPFELVPNPGANKVIVPKDYFLIMKAAASYTNISPTTPFLAIRFTGTANEASGYLGDDNTIPAITQFTSLFAFGAGEVRYRLPFAYFDDRGAVDGW
jgi:hypothetical protein